MSIVVESMQERMVGTCREWKQRNMSEENELSVRNYGSRANQRLKSLFEGSEQLWSKFEILKMKREAIDCFAEETGWVAIETSSGVGNQRGNKSVKER